MSTEEGTPCACRFDGNGKSLQECGEHAATHIRLREAEDLCDEHVAALLGVADVLDAADGETAMEAARRQMEWRRQGLHVLRESGEALQQHAQLGESAADCIRRLAARVAEMEQQVAALVRSLESLRNEDNCWCDGPEKDRRGETDITTHYIYCSEIRDALRAARWKP